MNPEKFANEVQKLIYDPTVGKIVALLIVLIVVWSAVRFLSRLVGNKITDSAARYKVRKLIGFLGFFAVLACAGFIFSDKMSRLTVAFGVAGAGIAFALQEVIASIAGWFAINFNNFFKVGDRVRLGGIKGDVIDIGILRTTLMELGDWVQGDLYNGRTVRVSNSFVFKDPVFNYSAEYPFLWDEITIPVHFDSDFKLLRKILDEVTEEVVGRYEPEAEKHWKQLVKKFMIEDARVEHFSAMTADENKVTFTLRYVTDYKHRRKTKDVLYEKIIDRIKSSEGKVIWAYSSMEIFTSKRQCESKK